MEAPRRLPEIIDARRYASRGYPHELWTALRRDHPFQWFEGEGIKPFWAVTRRDDIRWIGDHPARFLNAPRIMADFDVRPHLTWSRHLLNMDPPEHPAFRALLAPLVSSRTMGTRVARMEAIVAAVLRCVDDAGAAWEGDFSTEIAREISSMLMAEILGVAPADRRRLIRWAECMVSPSDPEYQRGRSTEETYVQAERELFHWFEPRIVERRAEPGADVVSLLASAKLLGKPLANRDVLSFCQLFVTAGIDTTTAALCRALLALAEHPDQFAWLAAHPDEIPGATEELLRFASPVVHFCRTAAEDFEIHGCKVLRGQSLVLFYPSANRDERAFDDPFTLRLDRRQNDHVAFGSGDHYCFGAPLARMLLHKFLGQLIAKVRRIELAGPAEYVHSSVIGGVKRLRVRFEKHPSEKRPG